MESGLKFWPQLQGKTGQKQRKKHYFSKIGLKPTQKSKRMNQMSTQPFELENGHFCQKWKKFWKNSEGGGLFPI